ncbi:hypothetical protein AOXY_G38276 [Acipenser oxyrinchus oxyrinchus]|uniref:catechol O-methyltransferase n=1 Tax=Acipenser oxyrinchus oxyrinchus TaxID=40147 RepID=A0AAD8FR17_ACIOX|nr:hypothetical protein AOXY_G38276 [Acipenser oxyrinchus oxyrinchus]
MESVINNARSLFPRCDKLEHRASISQPSLQRTAPNRSEMVSPAIVLAFVPLLMTLIIRTGDPDSILDTFDHWSSRVEYMSNIGPKKGKVLDRLITDNAPLTVLELGTHCGYSAVRIARGLPLGARLYSVEMDECNAAIAEKVIRLAGFDDDTVELIVSPSEEVIPQLRERFGIERLDFVFMDHWKRCYLRDLQLLEGSGLLGKGSIILADNIIFPGAPHFLRYVKSSGLYQHRIHQATLEYFRGIRDGMAELTFIGTK